MVSAVVPDVGVAVPLERRVGPEPASAGATRRIARPSAANDETTTAHTGRPSWSTVRNDSRRTLTGNDGPPVRNMGRTRAEHEIAREGEQWYGGPVEPDRGGRCLATPTLVGAVRSGPVDGPTGPGHYPGGVMVPGRPTADDRCHEVDHPARRAATAVGRPPRPGHRDRARPRRERRLARPERRHHARPHAGVAGGATRRRSDCQRRGHLGGGAR